MPLIPDPEIIDLLKLEDIVADVKMRFLEKHPDVLFDEVSPLMEMAATFAYRELLLRERINGVAEKLILELNRAYDSKRLATGSLAYYRQHVLSLPWIQDAAIVPKDGGTIKVYTIFVADQTGSNLRQKTEDYLNGPELRLLSDKLVVIEAKIRTIDIKAHLILNPGTQIDPAMVVDSLRTKLKPYSGICTGITKSIISALLFSPGVVDIAISMPEANVVAEEGVYHVVDKIEVGYGFR